jgi:hypothetical protein
MTELFISCVIFAAKIMWKDLNRLQPQKKMLKSKVCFPPFLYSPVRLYTLFFLKVIIFS